MAAPGRTFDAHLIVGTDDWVVDLTNDVAVSQRERRCVDYAAGGFGHSR